MPPLNSSLITCLNCRLSKLCLPDGLAAAEIQQLTQIITQPHPLQIDQMLYRQGSPCKNLYAVKTGSFRSFVTEADGTEQTLGFYFPGEMMGLDAFQNGQFSCSMIALETASVCELPLSSFSRLCGNLPGLQLRLFRVVGKELGSDQRKIMLLGHSSAQVKVATFLLMVAARYGALGLSQTQFNLSMRRHEIANFLGITIETVSRQLNLLTRQDFISIEQRHVQLKNIQGLENLVRNVTVTKPYL